MTLKSVGAVAALLSMCAPALAQVEILPPGHRKQAEADAAAYNSAMKPAPAPTPAAVQPAISPVVAQAPLPAAATTTLPANTEILVSMNEDLTSKGGRIEEGHKFGLSVVHDVMLNGMVVIPKGTPAFGEVTWLTGKGAFGKSGKMEIELRYIELNGRTIPVTGKYRQEGEGNTVGTVAGVVAVGVFAAFITGKSARIPQGRELKAFTKEALAVVMPQNAPSVAPVQAVMPVPGQPALQPVAVTSPARL